MGLMVPTIEALQSDEIQAIPPQSDASAITIVVWLVANTIMVVNPPPEVL
jgi:hypothetical protein